MQRNPFWGHMLQLQESEACVWGIAGISAVSSSSSHSSAWPQKRLCCKAVPSEPRHCGHEQTSRSKDKLLWTVLLLWWVGLHWAREQLFNWTAPLKSALSMPLSSCSRDNILWELICLWQLLRNLSSQKRRLDSWLSTVNSWEEINKRKENSSSPNAGTHWSSWLFIGTWGQNIGRTYYVSSYLLLLLYSCGGASQSKRLDCAADAQQLCPKYKHLLKQLAASRQVETKWRELLRVLPLSLTQTELHCE